MTIVGEAEAESVECAEESFLDSAASTILIGPPQCFRPPKKFVYFTERYFSQFLVRDCKGIAGNNVRLLLHSNNLCLLCIDLSHELISKQMIIASLSHAPKRSNSKVDRENIKVQGKRKKNGVICQKDTCLCHITTSEGVEFRIPACIDGHVLEINPLLVRRPSLLLEAPMTEGFIAIINPRSETSFDKFEKLSVCTSFETTLDNE
jgi:glycine cleavage system H lipoate-binding protein